MNTTLHPISFITAVALVSSVAAQAIWLPVPTTNSPPARHQACMAHDYLRDRIVLWGGYDGFGGTRWDTWEFDGTNWLQKFTAHSPNGGRGAMDYDRGRGRVVLVTGYGQNTATWEYDGVDWTPAAVATQPPSSGADLLVYDASRGVMVMFVQGNGSGAAETWEFNGYSWIYRQTSTTPPIRFDAGMVFDPVRNRVILHGGAVFGGSPAVTWEYDGSNWTPGPNAAVNPTREDFAFAFDGHRRRAVLFGGFGAPFGPGTFEYEPPAWQLRTTVGPSHRTGSSMVYDVIRQECVMFGGRDAQSFVTSNETFRYRSLTPALATPFGQGCAGSSVTPGFLPQPYHVPYIGMSFGVRFYSLPPNQPAFVVVGFSRTTFAGLPLPLSLQFLGMTNCQLFVSSDLSLGAAGTGSNAAAAFQIPALPTLNGTWLFLQGFALDIGGNPANLINTRAIECRVGVP